MPHPQSAGVERHVDAGTVAGLTYLVNDSIGGQHGAQVVFKRVGERHGDFANGEGRNGTAGGSAVTEQDPARYFARSCIKATQYRGGRDVCHNHRDWLNILACVDGVNDVGLHTHRETPFHQRREGKRGGRGPITQFIAQCAKLNELVQVNNAQRDAVVRDGPWNVGDGALVIVKTSQFECDFQSQTGGGAAGRNNRGRRQRGLCRGRCQHALRQGEAEQKGQHPPARCTLGKDAGVEACESWVHSDEECSVRQVTEDRSRTPNHPGRSCSRSWTTCPSKERTLFKPQVLIPCHEKPFNHPVVPSNLASKYLILSIYETSYVLCAPVCRIHNHGLGPIRPDD